MKINIEAILDQITLDYPQLKGLKLSEMNPQGHDHQSFRLGHHYVLRFPSAYEYSSQVIKEKEILVQIAKHLSIDVPLPLILFKPSSLFPYSFALMRYVEGAVYTKSLIDDFDFVDQLASICCELRLIKIDRKYLCGEHNFYRGAHIAVYEDETRNALSLLKQSEDRYLLETCLNKALKTQWNATPVFVHGDIAVNNILIANNKISGLIDFGSSGMGDPACDYAIAWTSMNDKQRVHFKNLLNIDEGTWERSKVWAMWKALITLESDEHKIVAQNTLNEILIDEKKKL